MRRDDLLLLLLALLLLAAMAITVLVGGSRSRHGYGGAELVPANPRSAVAFTFPSAAV